MRAPDPVAFTLFGMDIMWYGVLIGTGFVLAIILCYKRAPKHGIQSDHILDFAIFLIPASIIGARAYYVLFSWENYAGDLWKILNIRNGGLAIHGGIIAGFIVGLLVCKYHKIDILELADLVFPTVAPVSYTHLDVYKRQDEDGEEYWLARELQEVLQYKEWRNFVKVIDKAKAACRNTGNVENDYFVGVNKIVTTGIAT